VPELACWQVSTARLLRGATNRQPRKKAAAAARVYKEHAGPDAPQAGLASCSVSIPVAPRHGTPGLYGWSVTARCRGSNPFLSPSLRHPLQPPQHDCPLRE